MTPDKVKLDDIVRALETCSSEIAAYLNLQTGTVLQVGDEYLSYAEMAAQDDEDEHPQWELEIIAEARDILNHPDCYLQIRSSCDIHEYKIMEDFCNRCEDPGKRQQLLGAIRGKGAFRRFRDEADKLEVLDDWYAYRLKSLTEIAVKWCEENHVKFVRVDA